MNEYDRELLNEFVVESSELLEQVEATLLGIDDQASLEPEAINEIFRAVHTVKGTSGFFGFEVIGHLSHTMEHVLGGMREGRFTPQPDLIDLLLRANDRLRALVADPEASQGENVSDEVKGLERWLKAPGSADEGAKGDKAPAAEAAAAPVEEMAVEFEPSEELRAEIKKHGLNLYRLDLAVQADLVGKKRSISSFLGHLGSVGKILHIDPPQEALEAVPKGEERLFKVWLTSVLDPDLAPMGLALPPDKVHLEMVDPISGGQEAPAPAPAAPAEAPAPAAAPAAPAPAPAAPVAAAPAPAAAPAVVEPIAPVMPELDHHPADHPADHPAPTKRIGGMGNSDTLRVKTSLLDRLMQMAGELVLVRNRLLRRLDAERQSLDGVGGILNELNGITSEMQEQIMQTRLQPLGTVFGRFGRVVRDMSKKLGKSVRLETIGAEVELDKAILEGLADPLTHMIRNSIDHGLESPDEREALGKPREGVVRIRAYHEGGMVKIDVEDDGRGIDLERVKMTALRRGLLNSEQAARLTDGDALNLIFRPGFSTAQKVTDVSGRGVGMDVVRTNIEKLGGVVHASSRKGEGSQLSIKLPLTLAIVTSLIVETEGQRFALPQVGLESVVRLRPEKIAERVERIRDMDVLRYRDRLLPLVRLSDVLGLPRTYEDPETGERKEDRRGRLSDRRQYTKQIEEHEEEQRQSSDRRQALANVLRILVLRVGRNSYGLVVDAIVDNEEIVVKPLSRFLRDCACFSGATILGDGTIAMILDPVNIAQSANLTFSDIAREMAEEAAAEDRRSRKERIALIHFSNGGSETFAIPVTQVHRVESVNSSSVQRVGHKEYINYRGQALPLVRLHEHLDVGMPMEEPEEMRVIIPNLSGDSAGIVTHQIIDAREMELQVDESTISGQGLIGSAILGDDIVLVVDTYGIMESAGVQISGPELQALQGRRALLVEDTPFVRRTTESYLTGVGFDVEVIEDGREAWEAMQNEHYDVVVTGLRVAGLDGANLLAKMRGSPDHSGIPVVALAEEGAQDSQFDGYAQKLDRTELITTLLEVMHHAEEVAA